MPQTVPKAQAGEPCPRSGDRASEIEVSAGLAPYLRCRVGTVPRPCPACRRARPWESPLGYVRLVWLVVAVVLWRSGAVTPLGLACHTSRVNAPPTRRHLLQVAMHSQLRATSRLALPGLRVCAGGPLCLPSTVPLGTTPRLPGQDPGTAHPQHVPETVSPRLQGLLDSSWPGLPGPWLDCCPPGSRPRCWPPGPVPSSSVRPQAPLGPGAC